MKNKLILSILLLSSTILVSQESKTTFGLQYKPIIPVSFFNSSNIFESSGAYNFKMNPKYSNSFGMVIRHKINNTFSIESGLNYTQRNFKLSVTNSMINLDDFTTFGMRSYEIPIQFLTYVRASEHWYLNVSFGISHNVLASGIFSYGEETEDYFQNTFRKNGGYRALLANIGMEYRTEEKGHYYFGASLHRPWKAIGKIYPEFKNDISHFNDDQKFSLDMLGNFVTIDFRYFFSE